jgi:transposase InsO family protein
LLHLEIFPKFGHDVFGRDSFYSLLRRHDLLVKRKKSNKPHTTYSKHGYAVKPNLIKDLEVKYPNQVYVTDVTYIWVKDKWYYLVLVTDKYSRKIVGWELSEKHTHHEVERAVNKVLYINKQIKPIIFHSDRGSEFCCHDLINYLISNNILSSMTDADHCAQNALAERMNGILKQEFIPKDGYADFGTARASISHSIKLYNMARPNGGLAMRTPSEVHNGDYDNKGNKLRRNTTTKSAGEIIQSLLDNNALLLKIRKEAMGLS